MYDLETGIFMIPSFIQVQLQTVCELKNTNNYIIVYIKPYINSIY